MKDWFDDLRSDAGRIYVAHTIGTCRMGTDCDDAVVDPFGKSFEVENLCLADISVFPSALAANPALTIMALSLRGADAFLAGRAT